MNKNDLTIKNNLGEEINLSELERDFGYFEYDGMQLYIYEPFIQYFTDSPGNDEGYWDEWKTGAYDKNGRHYDVCASIWVERSKKEEHERKIENGEIDWNGHISKIEW